MTAAPPGWYPDPEAAGRQWRWWDGVRWAPPGYGHVPAFDPAAHAHALAMRAETTRRTGRWFRVVMVAFAVGTVVGGLGFGLWLHETSRFLDASGSSALPGGIIASELLVLPFGLASWAQLALFIAWLYNAGRFADLQPWPAVRSRTLGAFSPLIPILNFWWPYEAIRDCYPPGGRPRIALWWFVIQLAVPAPAMWVIAGTTFAAPAVVTAVVVVVTGAVLAIIPILGWRLIDDLDAMQRAHVSG